MVNTSIHALAVLNLIEQCKGLTLPVSGRLLGLDHLVSEHPGYEQSDSIQIMDCFRFPSPPVTHLNYNSRGRETVGWYQSTNLGSEESIKAIRLFADEEVPIKRCVCIIHDATKADKGLPSLRAFKLMDSFTADKFCVEGFNWKRWFKKITLLQYRDGLDESLKVNAKRLGTLGFYERKVRDRGNNLSCLELEKWVMMLNRKGHLETVRNAARGPMKLTNIVVSDVQVKEFQDGDSESDSDEEKRAMDIDIDEQEDSDLEMDVREEEHRIKLKFRRYDKTVYQEANGNRDVQYKRQLPPGEFKGRFSGDLMGMSFLTELSSESLPSKWYTRRVRDGIIAHAPPHMMIKGRRYRIKARVTITHESLIMLTVGTEDPRKTMVCCFCQSGLWEEGSESSRLFKCAHFFHGECFDDSLRNYMEMGITRITCPHCRCAKLRSR